MAGATQDYINYRVSKPDEAEVRGLDKQDTKEFADTGLLVDFFYGGS